ncbi:MAG: HAD-IA family hydrolase, partial [Streptosporangiales bacterium]|nr:HAD-IA family hydrolase [Streptosporangiales bacterium]
KTKLSPPCDACRNCPHSSGRSSATRTCATSPHKHTSVDLLSIALVTPVVVEQVGCTGVGSNVQAVVFDFFGTLTPGVTATSQETAHRRVAACLGLAEAAYLRAVAASWPQRCTGALGDIAETLRWLARECGGHPDEDAVSTACQIRRDAMRDQARLRPEAADVCGELVRRGLRLGLMSDCTHELPEIWPSLPVAPYFDAVVFSVEAGVRKPDPAMYTLACEGLGVEPAECLYVGDGGGNELTGATAMGMRAVQLAAPDNAGAFVHDREQGWRGAAVTGLRAVPSLLGPRRSVGVEPIEVDE